MISMANVKPLNTEALMLRGLSTDTKPIVKWVDGYNIQKKVGNGSIFFEIDTSDKYIYNEQDDVWILLKTGGSGGGGGTDYEYATDQEVVDIVNSIDWGGFIPEPQPHNPDDDYEFATDQDVLDIVNGINWN